MSKSRIIIKVGKGGYVPLSALSPLVDTTKVEYYSIKKNKNKTLTLKLYDQDGKVVKASAKK